MSDLDVIWNGFQENIKTDVRKASNRYNLEINTDVDIDKFLDLNDLVFARQNIKSPLSRKFIKNLDRACLRKGNRKIFTAVDQNGKQHAGVYLIWDENSAYYLLGGGDSELRNSGATSLCIWNAIQFASNVTKSFDFEGSMIEPIERFVRGFGGVQTPYLVISKTPSKLFRIKQLFFQLLKCLK